MPDPADDRTDPELERPLRRYDDYDRPRPRSGGMSGATIGLIIGAVLLIGTCVVVPVLVGLLLPAVQKVREAATRTKDMNNMKQIALAYHMDADANGGLYAPYAHDQKLAIRKGLSHRVSLLPYLEQDALFRRFQLDQPWDAPANKPASDTVVATYTTPFEPQPTADTPFRSFVGGGALFNGDGSPTKFADITDGSSNTILFVHAADQVPWAQPKEFLFVPGMPLPQFGHRFRPNEGGNVAMADGSVRFVPGSVSRKTLIAAITRSGGDELGSDW